MNLVRCAVQGVEIQLDANDAHLLQGGERALQHSVFGPSLQAPVDGVPVPEALGQSPPATAFSIDAEKRIEGLEMRNFQVSARFGKLIAIKSRCAWASSIASA